MSNDMVPITPEPQRPGLPSIDFVRSLGKPVLALDMPPERMQQELVRIMDSETVKSKRLVGKRVILLGVCAHLEEGIDDETGEIGVYRRVLLVCQDGTIIAGGNGIYKSIVRRIQAGLGPPWPQGLEVEIATRPTPLGDTTYLKQVVDEKKERGK